MNQDPKHAVNIVAQSVQAVPSPFIGLALVVLSACSGVEVDPTVTASSAIPIVESQQELDAFTLMRRSGVAGIPADTAGYFLDVQTARLQDLARAGVSITRAPDHIEIIMSGEESFESGSFALKPEMRTLLTELSGVLQEYAQSVILLEGHSDSRGDPAKNVRLSKARALAVAEHLVATGVAARRIAAWGRGAAQPIASNDTEAGRARNRRIEIEVWPATEA